MEFSLWVCILCDNGSTLSKGQNRTHVQIESICRQQNVCTLKKEILFGMGRKHFVKMRKCWLPAFSTFPTMFSKGFFFRAVQSMASK